MSAPFHIGPAARPLVTCRTVTADQLTAGSAVWSPSAGRFFFVACPTRRSRHGRVLVRWADGDTTAFTPGQVLAVATSPCAAEAFNRTVRRAA